MTDTAANLNREDVLSRYAEFTNKLQELRDHLDNFESQWKRVVRLNHSLAWLYASGIPIPANSADLLADQLKGLRVADSKIAKQSATLDEQISKVLDEVAAVSHSGRDRLPAVSGWDDPLHEAILRMVLHREGIASEKSPLPPPTETHTGVAGVSRGYTLTVTHTQFTRTVFAKFDDLERSQREWQAIKRLLTLPLPRAFILPLPTNQPGDWVIVSEAAGTPRAKSCQSLAHYLREQLTIARNNCRTCLEWTIAPLRDFYSLRVRSDEHFDRMHEYWSEVYPTLSHNSTNLRMLPSARRSKRVNRLIVGPRRWRTFGPDTTGTPN